MRLLYLIPLISLIICCCAGYRISDENLIIWDTSHTPVFGIENFKELVTIFGAHGLSVKAGKDVRGVTAKCLILAGPSQAYSDEEIDSILNYVENGGKLIILIHIPPKINLDPLLLALGFNVSNSILIDENGSTTITATSFEKSMITEGVNRLMFFGCYHTDNAIASCDCFADLDGDKIADEEERGKYGVVGYKKFGEGEVLVITDDAVLMDGLSNHGDNKRFAENIAKWVQFT
jgi:hypothetical protein